MSKELGMSTGEIAQRTSRSKTEISFLLRIVSSLHEKVSSAFRNGDITYSHAREILRLDDKSKQVVILNRIISENWTSRRTVVEVDLLMPESGKSEKEKELNRVEKVIKKNLGKDYGNRLQFKQGKKSESLIIKFTNKNELYELLKKVIGALNK